MDFKSAILAVARKLGIPAGHFDSVGIYDWPEIFKKIESRFIIRENTNTRFNWWWENLRKDSISLSFPQDDAWRHLNNIIDKNEKVWFVAGAPKGDRAKLWLFEGTVEFIQQIIGQFHHFEYYLVSKKYEWLLTEDHHGVLTGLGTVKDKLLSLSPVKEDI